MTCIAQTVDVFATGLVAGVFVMGTFAVLPAAARLEAPAHVLIRQHLIRRLATFMPPLMLSPIAASIGALTLCRTSVSLTLDTLGCALSLATIGVTVAVNGPLSRRFGRWKSRRIAPGLATGYPALESRAFDAHGRSGGCVRMRHPR